MTLLEATYSNVLQRMSWGAEWAVSLPAAVVAWAAIAHISKTKGRVEIVISRRIQAVSAAQLDKIAVKHRMTT